MVVNCCQESHKGYRKACHPLVAALIDNNGSVTAFFLELCLLLSLYLTLRLLCCFSLPVCGSSWKPKLTSFSNCLVGFIWCEVGRSARRGSDLGCAHAHHAARHHQVSARRIQNVFIKLDNLLFCMSFIKSFAFKRFQVQAQMEEINIESRVEIHIQSARHLAYILAASIIVAYNVYKLHWAHGFKW